MWQIKFSHEAEKLYKKKKDPFLCGRLNGSINELKIEMFWGPHIKKLRGKIDGLYRKDIGDYRIIYEVNIERKIIYIVAIGHRGGIY